ncbi:putative ubiquinone biosynthesis monooxygenase [Microbotryomycetes sp. JL201]|nr:putative ubiquinone biosynthesis monooxygenase [Microbotryomycetes sp. JL201]
MSPRPRVLAVTRPSAWLVRNSVRRCYSVHAQHAVVDKDLVVVGGGPAGLALAAAIGVSQLGSIILLEVLMVIYAASNTSITSSHGRLALIEAGDFKQQLQWQPKPDEYSNRVSSITADNIRFLTSEHLGRAQPRADLVHAFARSHRNSYAEIGVWQHMQHARTRGIEEMQVWDGISGSRITFTSPTVEPDPFDEAIARHDLRVTSPMATLVENLNLQRACLEALDSNQNKVELLDQTRVLGIEKDDAGWPVVQVGKPGADASQSRFLRARLLIGADGANSPVKSYSKIDTFGWPYNAQGVVASLHCVGPVALDLADAEVYLWTQLSDTTASLVWSTTPALASALKALPLDLLAKLVTAAFSLPYDALRQFLDQLERAQVPEAEQLEAVLSSLVAATAPAYDPSIVPDEFPPTVTSIQTGSVASFPLRLSHTSSYIGQPVNGRDLRTALVGDAAHTVHPLAGQGLNMGLGDIQALVETLEQTVQEGGDIGSYNALRSYPRSRYIPNHAILSTCDHLASLYSSTARPFVWARSTGLEIVNELDGLKRVLMGGAGAGVGVKYTKDGRELNPGLWGVVGSGVDSVRNGLKFVKSVGGLIGMQVKDRLSQMGSRR